MEELTKMQLNMIFTQYKLLTKSILFSKCFMFFRLIKYIFFLLISFKIFTKSGFFYKYFVLIIHFDIIKYFFFVTHSKATLPSTSLHFYLIAVCKVAFCYIFAKSLVTISIHQVLGHQVLYSYYCLLLSMFFK